MESIIASLPESVLSYKDSNGFTIVEYEFDPFTNMVIVDSIDEMKSGYFLRAKFGNDGNIQDIINHKLEKIVIDEAPAEFDYLMEFGSIRCLDTTTCMIENAYHVDFLMGERRTSMTSYYAVYYENKTSVVLVNPRCIISNDYIRVSGDTGGEFGHLVVSKYIHSSNYHLDQATIIHADGLKSTRYGMRKIQEENERWRKFVDELS